METTDSRFRALLYALLSPAPVRYGPGKPYFDPGKNALVLRHNWRRLIRETSRHARKRYGLPRVPSCPAASCSVLANLVVGYMVGAGETFRPKNGASMTTALARPASKGGYEECVWPLWPGRRGKPRFVDEETILAAADEMPPMAVAFLRRPGSKWSQRLRRMIRFGASHVIIIVRTGAGGLDAQYPAGGSWQPCEGLWRLAADGGRKRGRIWRFSARPLTWAPLALSGWEARCYGVDLAGRSAHDCPGVGIEVAR